MTRSNHMIPLANPKAEVDLLENELMQAVRRVLHQGQYILGPEVEAFEREFANEIGTRHAIGVANGTDAIALALRAVGVKPGDEVITVSHSAVATVAAIELVGAVPVLADIDPRSHCIDPVRVEALMTERTAAIVPVHIYGHPADMTALVPLAKKHELRIVEDCAQAHGARIGDADVGTLGDAAAFSFYPTKNLGALGDGGAVLTNSDGVAEQVRLLREYGWKERYTSLVCGTNSRLDEMQAAILRVKLKRMRANVDRRRDIARRYTAALDQKALVWNLPPDHMTHAMHLYVVEADNREAFQAFLRDRHVASARHYPLAIHAQPAYASRLRGCDALPNTERLYARIVSLPMFPELSDADVERVCTALTEWLSRR